MIDRSVKSMDYLVGGLRISLDDRSYTPGPKTHILNFTHAAVEAGVQTNIFLASSFPLLGRFSSVSQSGYANTSKAKLLVVDLVRLAACVWTGLILYFKTVRAPAPSIIYERLSVFQTMTFFHARRRSAFKVVEANGILSRETARDRRGLVLEGVAARMERLVLRRADLIVAVSSALKDELVKYAAITPEKIIVVQNGVDPSIISIPAERPRSEYTIGFAGSVVPWQHLDELLWAASECRNLGKPVRVELVGDGPALPALRHLTSTLKLEDFVSFRGRLAQRDAFAAMSRWSCGYAGHRASSSASMYHSPLKLYEYGGLGLDVVCSPSSDAVLLEKSGLTVRVFESKEVLVEALCDLVDLNSSHAVDRSSVRREFYMSNSWNARFDQVLKATIPRSNATAKSIDPRGRTW